MDELFPEGYDTEIEDEETDGVTGYKESVFFDHETGDFVRDGQHRVKSANGIEAWEQWCYNCIMTERDVYAAYGSTFGVKMHDALKAETRDLTESILTREITDGLMNDPYGRTNYIDVIEYEWRNSDELELHVVVVGIDDATIDITAMIDARNR